MLAALENGVQGGKWFSLIDKVYRLENLRSAFKKVKQNDGAGGVDHVTVKDFELNLERELAKLSEELRAGTYQPQAARRAYVEKPGTKAKRPLGIPTVYSYCTSYSLLWDSDSKSMLVRDKSLLCSFDST